MYALPLQSTKCTVTVDRSDSRQVCNQKILWCEGWYTDVNSQFSHEYNKPMGCTQHYMDAL